MRTVARALLLAVGASVLAAGGCRPSAAPRIAFVGGRTAERGAAFAADAARRASAQGGRAPQLVWLEDDGSSGSKAIRTAERVVADRAVIAVVGHASSTTSLAAAQIYNGAHLPELAPTASAPAYTLAGPYSFRMLPSDQSQAEFLARQVPLGARAAVIYMNTDYGRGLRRPLGERLSQRGLHPVLERSFTAPMDSIERKVIVDEVVAARPSILFWIGTPGPLEALLPSIRERTTDVIVYASDALDTNDTYSASGRLVGVRFVRFIDPESTDARTRALRDEFRRVTGQEITYEVVFAYDAVGLLARAVQDGARSREDIRRYLESLGRTRPAYAGVGGPIAFDSRREVPREYRLAEVTMSGVRGLQSR